MLKVSVIIPTLLKNIDILTRLISTLNSDNFVEEVIIINNSQKIFSNDSSKVKIIQSKKNMYVNPSWNYGVEISKNQLCALFNDDLLVCDGFCGQVAKLIEKEKNFGCCGMDDGFINNTKNVTTPELGKILLKKDELGRLINYWGCIIFIMKKDWIPIPNSMQIWCGDDFIRLKQHNQGKDIFKISNTYVSHLGSLSCSEKSFYPVKERDIRAYIKIDPSAKFRYNLSPKLKRFCCFIIRFIYQKKITKSGYLSFKICKIPVYRRKV